MKRTTDLRSWRIWLPLLLIWVVVVVLAFALGGSGAGSGALTGGPAGALGAYVAIRFLRRRGSMNRESD